MIYGKHHHPFKPLKTPKEELRRMKEEAGDRLFHFRTMKFFLLTSAFLLYL